MRFTGIKASNSTPGGQYEGNIRLKSSVLKFWVMSFRQREKQWVICLPNPEHLLQDGSEAMSEYVFPRLKNNPDLKRKIIAANKLIAIHNNSPSYRELSSVKEDIASLCDFLGIQKHWSREKQIRRCIEEIKQQRLPSKQPSKFSNN